MANYETITLYYYCMQLYSVFAETYSEAVKVLKGEYVVKAIEEHRMDRALIFCRTKLDCDNLEKYLQFRGQGNIGNVPEYSAV